MLVTFISQCEKKALKKTRRVLDAFADRIGDNTWQTVITEAGLNTVKKMLRQTASKSTAVSCHWIRSRSRSQFLWVVGNKSKFDERGVVPVNSTEKAILSKESNWHYLPLIKSLTGLAALFHDWGKSSDFFQEKLFKNAIIADPLRHEWLSILMLAIFVDGKTDEEWLGRLATGEISSDQIQKNLKEQNQKKITRQKPFNTLPDGASIIAWLILSHHRLPALSRQDAEDHLKGETVVDFRVLLKQLAAKWGYEYHSDDFDRDLSRCLQYSHGLPCDSVKWLRYAKRLASKLRNHLGLLQESLQDGRWRVIAHHCRLSLMLADHYHSSQPDKDPSWQDELELFANTNRKTRKTKHKLVEHLVKVAKQAIRNAHFMPAFEGRNEEMPRAQDVKKLGHKSQGKFGWQDKAVTSITNWRKEQGKQLDPDHFGFFAVNMASTGKGKTFANAKIMRALSPDQRSLRYILALGLRTLTLQTGDEYRDRIELGDDELAVLIGSKAVVDLHKSKNDPGLSESEEDLLENELDFTGDIPDEQLSTVLPDPKSRQFLYAPVLSCTIDHLMGATETRRGGRYILPALRLLSSDLVIDEIDDFDGTDLIALGRLIHLAGMLGRKVMISSATIPPDLAEGFFHAYQAGWDLFAKTRKMKPAIGCAWTDEFSTKVFALHSGGERILDLYRDHHIDFTGSRLDKLQREIVKRKAVIYPCLPLDDKADESCQDFFNSVALKAAVMLHNDHHNIDEVSGKKVSFGTIRLANISPCVDLTRYLLDSDLPEDFAIRTMAYHSQQLLLMRHNQEKHLDEVLKRTKGAQHSFDHKVIRHHLDGISSKNVLFILIATPVEEVGRDHDFDWAVVEPSSYRSFIQLAGRVLRHQELSEDITKANIALLQHNLKGLQGKKRVFCYPGYESENNELTSHDLKELLTGEDIEERLDACPRIVKKKEPKPTANLADLEHEVIHKLLTSYEKQGPESLQGWISGAWWLTAAPQTLVRFRDSEPQFPVFLIPEDDDYRFVEKSRDGELVPIEDVYAITRDEELSETAHQRLWLHRDYEKLLQGMHKFDKRHAALIFGEINLPTYRGQDPGPYIYSSQLGLVRK